MFLNQKLSQFQTFWSMTERSIKVTKPFLLDVIINNTLMTILQILIFTYFMPAFGLNKDFGTFMAFSMVALQVFFTSVFGLHTLLGEVLNPEDGILQYELTAPIHPSFVFIKCAFEFIHQSFFTTLPIIVAVKLLMWNRISFEYFSFFKFHFLLLCVALFSGFFTLFLVSITPNRSAVGNLLTRIVFPMWFLGGLQFSWQSLYNISPALAYLNLLNPLTYAYEGCRAATLNPTLSLPYWYCIPALLFCTAFFGTLGINRLKQRLDCV